MKVVIVDYGMGNLRSVFNKAKASCANTIVSDEPSVIASADKLILPGVGHFGKGMENLNARGLTPALNNKVVVENTPILGICLGMQLFSSFSEEGDATGLGWIDGTTKKFPAALPIKVPHMGWNTLDIQQDCSITMSIPEDEQYYFCHSYLFDCADKNDIATRTFYGMEFTSAVNRGNIHGVQFHPEKSHDHGARIISDFLLAA